MSFRPEASRTSDTALELEQIEKRFGETRALAGASLSVRPGTVHALLGENGAGKTTLMRIAYGVIQPDNGRILLRGLPVRFRSPAVAIRHGLGMVHQHFTNVPAMTVAENVALGNKGLYSRQRQNDFVRALSQRTGLPLDPERTVSGLAVGAQQRLEILKALAREVRVLIMDEPTAVLAPAEAEELLRWLRSFADQGGSVILITHKLREALAISDDVTVLRYGRTILSKSARSASSDELARAMLGDASAPALARSARTAGRIVLRLVKVSVRDEAGKVRVSDADAEVRQGEIIGIVALENSGHDFLLRAIAGRLPPSGGMIERDSPVAFIPEDRQRDAIVMSFPLTENVALRGSGFARGIIRWRDVRARTEQLVRDFDIRTSSIDVPVRTLSGGNQQKLVLARELSDDPSLVVAQNPTRGLDIRATADVHDRLRSAAANGAGVVLYSSDLDEVLSLADRAIAIHDGRLRAVPNDREAAGRAMLGLP